MDVTARRRLGGVRTCGPGYQESHQDRDARRTSDPLQGHGDLIEEEPDGPPFLVGRDPGFRIEAEDRHAALGPVRPDRNHQGAEAGLRKGRAARGSPGPGPLAPVRRGPGDSGQSR